MPRVRGAAGRMTLQVSVVGIDGSGKSTLAAALAVVLAAEHGLVAGSAVGDEFWIRAPELDLAGPGFHPQGYAIAARLNRMVRMLTRVLVNNRALYPSAKVIQMLLQDNAAAKLSSRYSVDVMVSDGNLFLSGAGRAFNYRGPASNPPTVDDVDRGFRHLLENAALPEDSAARLPSLTAARILAVAARLTRMQGIWVPDQALWLDLPPAAAMARVHSRGARVDRHENPDDLATAREGYVRVLEVVRRHRGADSAHVIVVDSMRAGTVLAAATEALQLHLPEPAGRGSRGGALHEAASRQSVTRRVLTYRYLGRYLLRRFFEGAWREPLFVLSPPGREFLREGYSAGVMRSIYDQPQRPALLSRAFYGYPLHRAVRDRLRILQRSIGAELRQRVSGGGQVKVFTAPSGFAYDLLGPIRDLARDDPRAAAQIEVVAADLDPTGELEPALRKAANEAGCALTFIRGDLTDAAFRDECGRLGPFDVALFVGLSSWLPKPPFVAHLKWLRACMAGGGVLVTDVFTPAAYSVGGAAMGYRASYYPPAVMRTVLDYCGFDGSSVKVESGADGINHVILASPGPIA